MDENKKQIYQFIELQKRAMGHDESREYMEISDWDTMITLGNRNKCNLLLNNEVSKNQDTYNISEERLEKWNEFSIRDFLNAYNKFGEFRRVMDKLQNNGIYPVVLKGYTLAILYPSIFQRFSSDLDIKLAVAEKEMVRKVLTSEMDFIWNEADSKENVDIYYNNILLIEAHYTLWEDYEGENIQILRNEELDAPSTLIDVEIADDLTVRTLGYTEHLILQMFHIVKHYILEGIESRYFCDIALYINKYRDEIDFDRFWNVFKKIHFEEFCIIYFSECIKHFGMTKEPLCGREEKLPDDEYAFLRDIIYQGKRDLNDRADYSLLGILSPYVNGGKKSADSKSGRALQALFPSADDIDMKYSYCKKYHCLLPIAWVHRAFRTIFFKFTKGDKVYGAGKKLKESEYRIQMMRNVGIK